MMIYPVELGDVEPGLKEKEGKVVDILIRFTEKKRR